MGDIFTVAHGDNAIGSKQADMFFFVSGSNPNLATHISAGAGNDSIGLSGKFIVADVGTGTDSVFAQTADGDNNTNQVIVQSNTNRNGLANVVFINSTQPNM
jgi:hypothetical protein